MVAFCDISSKIEKTHEFLKWQVLEDNAELGIDNWRNGITEKVARTALDLIEDVDLT
jgi:hypothetical protein